MGLEVGAAVAGSMSGMHVREPPQAVAMTG